jgi:catechol 2,3-dioxygenase-like lactoylglutathione lyase family enzyme
MKARLYHFQLNVGRADRSLPFYRNLFQYFGFEIINDSVRHLGATDGERDFWIVETGQEFQDQPFERKSTGIHHLAFRVEDKAEVDRFYQEFLIDQNVNTLYSAPAYYTEYQESYYAVYFEDPDGLKLEVMHLSGVPHPTFYQP